jgi:hypothetical protein
MDTPVCVLPLSMACSIGAEPRRSGRRDGCTFRPPYVARERIRGGTRRPKDTAIMRFGTNGGGGLQLVNVSKVCVGRDRSFAVSWMGTASYQFVWMCRSVQ